jgi:acetolactate synthase-1/2/3 large subunit
MDINRRDVLKVVGAGALLALQKPTPTVAGLRREPGWVRGRMTGAEALVETLIQEGTDCVFGIPGAQENEVWDTFKSKRLPYLLCTHEFSAATMADGVARATGKPGVLFIVPGPGIANALTGLGEALLDSIPLVCIAGDVAIGPRARPFQVHCLNQAALLRPVTKQVIEVRRVDDISLAVRQAFQCARAGEPGPVGVVIPYNLFIEACHVNSGPLSPLAVPCDDEAVRTALAMLANRRHKVGIYAGLGCMDYSASLVQLAEVLQAPVATSMCGKGAMPENHPLSVGWGYGPQGTKTAEHIFQHVDLVLAIGVKFSEVSTGFYSLPTNKTLVHVDINRDNLGAAMRASHCVHSDAGLFLAKALECADTLRRPADPRLLEQIRLNKLEEDRGYCEPIARCGVDPVYFLRKLRQLTREDALAFIDVTVSQYWATEIFRVCCPRLFFNPTDNQAMGWSIPAALGAQKVLHGRQVVTVTGDGCFLMSAMEISTAARECLPVKFFVLDDQAYHYMQELQLPAYVRTTGTILAHMDYRALAQGFGVAYQEITSNDELEARLRGSLECNGPVLTRIVTDYHCRKVRWIKAARDRYTRELTTDQKLRFLARIGSRSLRRMPEND